MQTETQKNWNEYFDSKKKRNLKPPIIIIIGLLLIITASFAYINPLDLSFQDVNRIFRDLLGANDPYLDGDMMNAMIKEVDNMESRNDDYIDQLLSYNAEKPDQEFMDDWGSFLAKSKNRLDEMHYHSSYSEFITACGNMLDESEKLQQFILSKNVLDTIGDSDIYDRIDRIYTFSDQIDEELMKAFDNNGIDYYEDDDYINYYYN